jgi:membrane fusion protein
VTYSAPPTNHPVPSRFDPPSEPAPAPTPLFRPEATAARAPQMVGEVLLTHRAGSGWAAMFALAAVLAVVTFFTWGSYTRRATGSGFISPAEGVVQITAPQAGVIIEPPVTEGAAVKAGDVMFVLSTDRGAIGDEGYQQVISTSMRDRLQLFEQQRLSTAEAAQADVQAQRRRADVMARERAKLRDQLADLNLRIKTANETAVRYAGLLERGLVTRDQHATKEAEAAELLARVRALEREDLNLQREMATIESNIQAARARQEAADQGIEREAAGVREQLADAEARRRIVLVAPRDGVATLVQAVRGSAVANGRPLATLVGKDAKLQCTLYAQSRTVGFLKPGTPVGLRVAAFPYQKFGHLMGQVQSVSAFPAQPQEVSGLISASDAAGEPVYAVTVSLAAQAMPGPASPMPLRAGMRVEADFMLERRKLWEWALEPLFALRRSAST